MHADHDPHVRRVRGGFTVIELLVAMLVGGVVLTLAHSLLTSVADAEQRSKAISDGARERSAFYDLLRTTVLQIELPGAGGTSFAGDTITSAFASWCQTASGWKARCEVQISVRPDRFVCRAELVAGDETVVWAGTAPSPCHLRYLTQAGGGGVWTRRWTNTSTLPPAIGLVVGSDSMTFRPGRRG